MSFNASIAASGGASGAAEAPDHPIGTLTSFLQTCHVSQPPRGVLANLRANISQLRDERDHYLNILMQALFQFFLHKIAIAYRAGLDEIEIRVGIEEVSNILPSFATVGDLIIQLDNKHNYSTFFEFNDQTTTIDFQRQIAQVIQTISNEDGITVQRKNTYFGIVYNFSWQL